VFNLEHLQHSYLTRGSSPVLRTIFEIFKLVLFLATASVKLLLNTRVVAYSKDLLLVLKSAQLLTIPAAFLAWLRLSTYMAIVSVAIVISFHLKSQPSKLERDLALPFGLLFWLLSLACLTSGLANYIRTVQRYSRRAALVQSGWKTQLVSRKFLLPRSISTAVALLQVY